MVLRATAAGLRRAARAWSLGAFLLVLNVLTAALLAVPLAVMLEADLRERDAASGLMYGFEYPWWSHWEDTRPGWPSTWAATWREDRSSSPSTCLRRCRRPSA